MMNPGFSVPITVDQEPSLPSISVKWQLLHSEAFISIDYSVVACIYGEP